ncbi:MAG: hypothetical protein M1821_007693 [Bathelium mastoideum]|nr:MAG: hypothetical protein M1821_007693 [Bathelium mastoideum]
MPSNISSLIATLLSTYTNLARILDYAVSDSPGITWLNLPLSLMVESLRPMVPRSYPISSLSMTCPRQMGITVAVDCLKANETVKAFGIASTYLSSFNTANGHEGQLSYPRPLTEPTLHCQVRRSQFKLPAHPSTPMIVVGAGTGIAPFRAFLQEKARLASIGREVGQMLVFAGFRNPDHDYLYQAEYEDFESKALSGSLNVYTAFPRNFGQAKTYVQDKIEHKGEAVLHMLLDQDAALSVCGSAAMSRGVGQKFEELIKRKRGWDDEKVRHWRETKRKTKRLQEDVWG